LPFPSLHSELTQLAARHLPSPRSPPEPTPALFFRHPLPPLRSPRWVLLYASTSGPPGTSGAVPASPSRTRRRLPSCCPIGGFPAHLLPVLFSPSDLPQRLVLLVCLMCRPTAVPPSPLTPKCDCPLVPTGVTLFRQPTRLPSRSSPSSCPCLPLHFIPSPIVSLTCRAVPRAASLHVSAPHPPPPPGTFSSRPLDSPP